MKCFRLLLLLILLPVAGVRAEPQPTVIILLPGTSLQEWQAANAPNLHHLMVTGALAVMNTRTARLPSDHARETPESAMLTLGAGARAAGDRDALAFLPQEETVSSLRATAKDLYRRRMGQSPRHGFAINIAWPAVLGANQKIGYRLRLGNLGDVLETHGVNFMAGGGPYSSAVAATSQGAVRRVTASPASGGQCLIWDAGSDIAAADQAIKEAAAQTELTNGHLMILSPFAGDSDYAQGRRLTPVLEWGRDVPIGLLRSPSTRRAGLVADTDFAPTVAANFDLTREDFAVWPFGEPWQAIPAAHPEQQVSALEAQAVKQAQGMKVLPYLAVSLAVWMLAGTALACGKRLPSFLPIPPLVFLSAALFSDGVLSLAVWFFLLLLSALLFTRRFGTRPVTNTLLAILAASLILDMMTGSRLMQRGLLGYSAVEGARYYGIGNEAMGVLIGALLVLAARYRRDHGLLQGLIFLTLGAVALLLGSAQAGAKAGGLLVSLASFGAFGFISLGGKWSVRSVCLLAALVVSVITLVAVGDSVSGSRLHSHMGEAVRRIQMGGLSEAGDIIKRKLAVDSRLAYHSAWAGPLWGGAVCLWLLWKRKPALTREEQALRTAGTVGIAASVALNDAGIVAGALCLVPLWCDAIVTDTKRAAPAAENSAARAAHELGGESY